MAIQSSFSKIGNQMMTRRQMRDAVKKLPEHLLDKPPTIPKAWKIENAIANYLIGRSADKVPDVAHFIWFSGKECAGGTPFKTIPPEALAVIQKFKTLNPHFQVKLWTDAPHLMARTVRSATHESGFPPIQIESFFNLFSDATPWPKYTQAEKATLHAAILRELHRTNRNPQAAKDIAQFVVLRHEPGWFFDLDAKFYKPLPKAYAEYGALCDGENGMMAFTKHGRPELDEILSNFANAYDIKRDIFFTKEDFQKIKAALARTSGLTFNDLKDCIIYRKKIDVKGNRTETTLGELLGSSSKAQGFLQPEKHLKGWLDKIYVMFDLKGTSGRRILTDELCFHYHSVTGCHQSFWDGLTNCGIVRVPNSSVFSEDPKVESWQNLPGLRRRASSLDLPTWMSTPHQKK